MKEYLMLWKIKKVCLHSLTVAWCYCLAAVGAVLQVVDYVAEPLGDPDLRNQIGAATGDPTTAGRILLGISVVTVLARLRSLRKAA